MMKATVQEFSACSSPHAVGVSETVLEDKYKTNCDAENSGIQEDQKSPLKLQYLSLSLLNEDSASGFVKFLSALLFGVSSIAIMIIVKMILTTYDFNCFMFVAAVQYMGTIVVLLLQRNVFHSIATFPLDNFFRTLIMSLFPLPILFLANTLCGLGATQDLSMPTFVLLRRFSIVMTLVLELVILRRVPSKLVVLSVMLMVLGALIATGFDMTLSLTGVTLVLLNDLFTALQGVMLRKKIDELSRTVKTEGIMFYNNVFALAVTTVLVALNVNGELDKLYAYEHWESPGFLFLLVTSSVMGFILNYFMFLCTKLNSPLTTAMVGGVKNVITSYIGMFFKDYVFSHYSFAGLNIAVAGTLIYSKAEMDKIWKADAARQELEEKEAGVQEVS